MTGEELKELRVRHKMTQVKLSQKVGVVPSTVHSWENNVHPIGKSYLRKIRCIFRLPIPREEVVAKQEERKEIRDALADIGNDSIAKMDDNDPRLIRLQKAMGAR